MDAFPRLARRRLKQALAGSLSVGVIASAMIPATPASAQSFAPSVSVCSGASIDAADLTDVIEPIVTGIATPVEGTVNSVIGVVSILGIVPPLTIDATGIITDATDGGPITVNVFDVEGDPVALGGECNVTADSFTLNDESGIAIGGNRITGLGSNGDEAYSGNIDAIAFGNRARVEDAATGSVAIGADAQASAANSVAIGAGSVADRGPQLAYNTVGLLLPQDSAGEVSVGSAGAERQITHVAAGSAPTDAVNVAQLEGVAGEIAALDARAVQYDDASQAQVTLAGAGGTVISNVAPGALSPTSTEAVNGAQLYATNQQVDANTTAIANLTTLVTSGGGSPVQYSDAGTPTTPNGGTVSDDTTLVGTGSGPVRLHNVADGSAPTDAANVGQLQTVADAVAALDANAVQYDDGTQARVTLAGGSGTTIDNVADGTLSASSAEAVNGSQLHATNQQVATNTQNIADNRTDIDINTQNIANNTADITDIRNTLTGSTTVPVQYSDAATPTVPNGGTISDDVTMIGQSGGPVALHNVAAGTSTTDAVNLGQMQSGLDQTLASANDYTDQRVAAVTADLRSLQRDSSAGTAGALAAAALPQAMDPGASMLSLSVGQFRSEIAWAMGASTTFNDGRGVIRIGGTVNSQGHAGANAGVGFQF